MVAVDPTVRLLATDAVINRGNSGGPMFNMDGEVVGVVSHILSAAGGAEGLGFVASSNLARRVLLEEPTMWSGMSGFLLDGELAGVFNLNQGAGVLVQRVAAGSPADRLGLRPGTLSGRIGEHELLLGGDVILAVQGIRLDEPAAVHRIRAAIAPGSGVAIEVEVLRAGGVLRLTTTHPATSRENR
jgi:S1-C subfamily serine protease